MAIHNSVLAGKMRGTVDNLVAYVSEGKGIIRVKPLKVKDPKTDAQLVQRSKWKGAVGILNAFFPVYDLTYPGSTIKKRNAFLKNNLNIVSVDENFVPTIDPMDIKCTPGSGLRRPEVSVTHRDGILRISQTAMEASSNVLKTDQVYLAIYESGFKELELKTLNTAGSSGTTSFNLLKGWNIENVYCYAFFVSKSGKRVSGTDVFKPESEE